MTTAHRNGPAQPPRRSWLSLAAATVLAGGTAALLAACAGPTPPVPGAGPREGAAPAAGQPPIVFVHGNGDNAATWIAQVWRFESNGWPRERLHAVNLPNPTARDDNTVAQPGRSSADENSQALGAAVDAVLARTGARQVVLMANSRGGNAIRHYVQNLGGAAKVSHAILGGTPNHGVWSNALFRPNNEFNGAGAFLKQLNEPKGANGDEVTPGIAWMTLRSDHNDKFAQPDGVWIGAKGVPTNVTAEGPALKGATNVVLPGLDHREVSYHPQAFEHAWRFLTGRAPATLAVTPEAAPVLDGEVSGLGPAGADNRPLAGANVQVFAVNATTGERQGAAVYSKSTGADGRWGPFKASPTQTYEFEVATPGHATLHVYRSPFPRSSTLVHFRAERLNDADKAAASVVVFTRPRGYFGLPRDQISFDGAAPVGVPTGVAGVSSSRLRLKDGVGRAVPTSFASGPLREQIVARAWPAAENRLVVVELTE